VTFIFNVVIPVLAAIAIVVALFFVGRAVSQRAQGKNQPYGVGRQALRRSMQLDFIRGMAAALVGLLLFGVSSLSGVVESAVPQSSASPTAVIEAAPDVASATPTPTATVAASTPTPTTTPTVITPTMTPSSTPEPVPETAVVQSGVGVWLRAGPSAEAEQLEWLLDGTILTLLSDRQVGEDFEWQEVRAPSGQEGWVAVEFIIYDTDLEEEPPAAEEDDE
jgi:hypothetical protein